MDAKIRLMELSQGYQHASVLLAACKTGVFAGLGKQSVTATELATELDLDTRALETVLLALTADEILELRDGRFRLTDEYSPFLLPDSDQTQASILNHNFQCLQNWSHLDEILRTGKPAESSHDITNEDDAEQTRNFICGMADISRVSSAEVSCKIDLATHRRMLDLGGGPATASLTFARRNPHLHCVVFDREGPLAIAREEIEKADLGDRVTTRVGDLFADEYIEKPDESFDLIYISNIIHCFAVEQTVEIVRKARRALTEDGLLVLKDFFLKPDRVSPVFGAFFSVNMLTATEGGKSYTTEETCDILNREGFEVVRVHDIAAASRLIVARKA